MGCWGRCIRKEFDTDERGKTRIRFKNPRSSVLVRVRDSLQTSEVFGTRLRWENEGLSEDDRAGIQLETSEVWEGVDGLSCWLWCLLYCPLDFFAHSGDAKWQTVRGAVCAVD